MVSQCLYMASGAWWSGYREVPSGFLLQLHLPKFKTLTDIHLINLHKLNKSHMLYIHMSICYSLTNQPHHTEKNVDRHRQEPIQQQILSRVKLDVKFVFL